MKFFKVRLLNDTNSVILIVLPLPLIKKTRPSSVAQVKRKKSKDVLLPSKLKSRKLSPITIEKNFKNALQSLQVA